MRREMQPISIEVSDDGKVILSQSRFDLNELDPKIELTLEQTPLVAAWLYEATGTAAASGTEVDDSTIPVRYLARGPEAEAEQLEVFCNDDGMIILQIDEDAFIEIAPVMAKRLRKQLSAAIHTSLSDLLRSDTET